MDLAIVAAVYDAVNDNNFEALARLVESGNPLVLRDNEARELIVKKLLNKQIRLPGRPSDTSKQRSEDNAICARFAFWVAKGKSYWSQTSSDTALALTASEFGVSCDCGKRGKIRLALKRGWRKKASILKCVIDGLLDDTPDFDSESSQEWGLLLERAELVMDNITKKVEKN